MLIKLTMKEGGRGREREGGEKKLGKGRGVRERKCGGRKKKNVEEGRILSSTLEIVVLNNYLHCIE